MSPWNKIWAALILPKPAPPKMEIQAWVNNQPIAVRYRLGRSPRWSWVLRLPRFMQSWAVFQRWEWFAQLDGPLPKTGERVVLRYGTNITE